MAEGDPATPQIQVNVSPRTLWIALFPFMAAFSALAYSAFALDFIAELPSGKSIFYGQLHIYIGHVLLFLLGPIMALFAPDWWKVFMGVIIGGLVGFGLFILKMTADYLYGGVPFAFYIISISWVYWVLAYALATLLGMWMRHSPKRKDAGI